MILGSQLGPVWVHKGSKLVLLLIYNNFMLINFRGENRKMECRSLCFPLVPRHRFNFQVAGVRARAPCSTVIFAPSSGDFVQSNFQNKSMDLRCGRLGKRNQ